MSERQKKRNRYFLIVVPLLCVVSQGCWGNDFGMVEGIVSLDGKPLEGGSVTFYPAESGPLSYSDIGSQWIVPNPYGVASGRVAGAIYSDGFLSFGPPIARHVAPRDPRHLKKFRFVTAPKRHRICMSK